MSGNGDEFERSGNAVGREVALLERVRLAVREVDDPDPGRLTPEDVDILRADPDLAELAEVAELYV